MQQMEHFKKTNQGIHLESEFIRWKMFGFWHGIARTEILLPQNASQEFSDREIVWSSIEKIEKSKTRHLVRGIEIELSKEWNPGNRGLTQGNKKS